VGGFFFFPECVAMSYASPLQWMKVVVVKWGQKMSGNSGNTSLLSCEDHMEMDGISLFYRKNGGYP
jgi:hypothetical protein